MSLWVAVPCGIGSALLYGAATAVQHNAAHNDGAADARGLLRLLVDPRWLLSIGGDSLGLLLQVIALATGPVVLIQPLLVLALPVSLPVGWLLGGPRPGRGDYLACGAILAGLAVFFVIVGDPGSGRPLGVRATVWLAAVTIVAGLAACLAVRGRGVTLRAGVFGGVAGSMFGVVGVLINEVAGHGFSGLKHSAGLVPLVGLIAVGGIGMTLTQLSFQIGALGASFPANESAAPVVAVLLGGLLLHEHVPLSPLLGVAYAACLVAIVLGAVRLANPSAPAPTPGAAQ